MSVNDMVLVGSLAVNFFMLVVFVYQTRHLGTQTRMLTRSLEYSSYNKLVDHLNDVSRLHIQDAEVQAIFEEMPFIRKSVQQDPRLAIDKIGLAWIIINRYEAAFVGHQLGVLPAGEWDVWRERLIKDLSLPFVRDVWVNDVKNFKYNAKFTQLMDDIISS